MQEVVEECLMEASKKGCKSIAFPTMGTGKLGYPSDQCASLMFSAVRSYFKKSGRRNKIEEVQIIVYQRDNETLEVGDWNIL
jgi:O-acetyl-ADP-ribose deacetylase (regulator of RNase III)